MDLFIFFFFFVCKFTYIVEIFFRILFCLLSMLSFNISYHSYWTHSPIKVASLVAKQEYVLFVLVKMLGNPEYPTQLCSNRGSLELVFDFPN